MQAKLLLYSYITSKPINYLDEITMRHVYLYCKHCRVI